MEASQGGAPEHIPYKVDHVAEHEDLMPGGRFRKVTEVHYTGPHGHTGSVAIPTEMAHPGEVDRQIQAKLDHVVGIHELGPQPHPENRA